MSYYGPLECWDCGDTGGPFVRVGASLICESCDDAGKAILAELRAKVQEAGQ
ncbi:hypothetical protein AB0K71_28425 [Streptomyces syringium]|uniref:hypothetical protein n=1 Tax=Streptomyces syringium TaxID=76729 RepID=UPI0033A2611B